MRTPIHRVSFLAATVIGFVMAARGLEAQQPPTVKVAKSVLERYVGEYVYPNGNTVAVRLRGDTMFRETQGGSVPFVPISDTLFRVGPVFTAAFVIDGAGDVTQIVSDGVATEYVLRRKGARPLPPTGSSATAAPRISRDILERYVGVYDYLPGQMGRTDLTIVVRLRGDKLTRNTGDGEVTLTPTSETRFRVGDTSIMTEFVVDEAGVTQVLGSGGQQMLARLRAKR